MSKFESNASMVMAIANALGELRYEVVFVGGSIASLLITEHVGEIRPTDDVDVVVNADSYSSYNAFLERVRQIGFQHDMTGPMCRFVFDETKIDIMPTEESVLGFHNIWYSTVMETACLFRLPDNSEIRLVSAPLFLCTKFEAFVDRGNGDYLGSEDIEDIVAVINGREELADECSASQIAVKSYLNKRLNSLLDDARFTNVVPGLLPYTSSARENLFFDRLKNLISVTEV